MINALYTIIIYPITQIIELVFVFSQKVFKTPGISVLAIGAAISILTLPLYAVAEKWQQIERDTQKRLAPGIAKIKAVFTGDEQYMILSTYYRQNHYHPIFTLRSTFGLLIQIPFFIAAFSYLSHLDALKGASFFLINDLGAPDALFGGVNVLPVIMTLINIIAGAIYTRGFPLKEKIQLYGMALIFLVLLYNSPAGLVLYWTLNNVFSLLKNLYYAIDSKSVDSKHKNTVIAGALSAFCVFVIFYLLAIHSGNSYMRLVLSLIFVGIAIFPWTIPLAKKGLRKLPSGLYSVREQLSLFLCVSAAFWALVGLVTPSVLIASSPQEFSFIDSYTTPIFFLYTTALQSFGFFVFWPFCLYALFSTKVKEVGTLLYLALFLGALCNMFLFHGNYGVISVALEFSGSVEHTGKEIIINLLALCVPAVMVILLFVKNKKQILLAVPVICLVSFCALTAVNSVKINRAYRDIAAFHTSEQKTQQTVEPIFPLSKTGKNVVVIMLDRAISVFVPYILEESPELKEIYSGFIYYPNTVSFNGYTAIGSPPIFGGYEATPEEINKRVDVPLKRKHNEALMMMPRIFSEAGYAVTATDSPYANYSTQPPDMRIYEELPSVATYLTDSAYTDIWMKEHNFALPSISDILKRSILWYSLFRAAPLALRECIYLYGNWCAPIANHSLKLTLNGYSVLDYLPKLTDTASSAENTALFLVNNTTHEGSLLQAPDYIPVAAVTNYGTSPFRHSAAYHINIASLKRIADWFRYLKDEDVYDNTRIILVSDHGPESNFVTKIGLPFNVDQFNPLLMVKDFGASGTLQTDRDFMTNADVPTLALRNLFTDPINPYTGKKITDKNKENPVYIAISGSIHTGDPNATQFVLNPKKDYYVHDNIFDPANWSAAAAAAQ